MKKGNTGIKKVDRNKPFTTSDIAVVTHHKDGLDVVEAAGVTFLTYIEAEQKNGNHAGCICCLQSFYPHLNRMSLYSRLTRHK
jgi:hypothetical protein